MVDTFTLSMANRKHRVKIKWSANFAYTIGLLVTDGSLSNDGRHIDFTSKDLELIKHVRTALDLQTRITTKSRGQTDTKNYYRIQIGDVTFYEFLEKIGLSPKKTKTMGIIAIPKKYFFDFLRGHFDGDGTFYSYFDPRWPKSFLFYLVFVSASPKHIYWLQNQITQLLGIKSHITKARTDSIYQLKFSKNAAIPVIQKMYGSSNKMCLQRKHLKIKSALSILA